MLGIGISNDRKLFEHHMVQVCSESTKFYRPLCNSILRSTKSKKRKENADNFKYVYSIHSSISIGVGSLRCFVFLSTSAAVKFYSKNCILTICCFFSSVSCRRHSLRARQKYPTLFQCAGQNRFLFFMCNHFQATKIVCTSMKLYIYNKHHICFYEG